jgi:hypothetical protein
MTWFKFLAPGAAGPFSGYRWPVPCGRPGGWVLADGPLDPCRSGLHLCQESDLPFWLLDELYTVDVDGPVEEHDTFVLAHRARLAGRVEAWAREEAYLFACDCAWRVRDMVVAALRRADRDVLAARLEGCASVEELAQVSRAATQDPAAGGARLAGYALDAATYAKETTSGSGWAAASATTGFIAATVARVAAREGDGLAAAAAERAHQAQWIVDVVLAGL